MACMPQSRVQKILHINYIDQQYSQGSLFVLEPIEIKLQKHVPACVQKEDLKRGQTPYSGNDPVDKDAGILHLRHHKWK